MSTPTEYALRRVLVVGPSLGSRAALAVELRARGFEVEEATDGAIAADLALRSPPAAIVADLWMDGISGVQLCRLLRREPATAEVPIVLCGDGNDPRDRFWAERAGARAFVTKDRAIELGAAVQRLAAPPVEEEPFFFQLGGGATDIRDRLATALDAALFDSVIAAEVRALASAADRDRLFDLTARFLAQVVRYRWLALAIDEPDHVAVHHRADEAVTAEVRAALPQVNEVTLFVADDVPVAGKPFAPATTIPIAFGNGRVGTLAVSFASEEDADNARPILALVARELGGPIRMASLVEESRRLATTDPLTGLANRRAFTAVMERELALSMRYGSELALAVLDLDCFKRINDERGHGVGDRVLAVVGELLRGSTLRRTDLAARWGGEEFVVALPCTGLAGARLAAERLRAQIEMLVVTDDRGRPVPVTVSIGVTTALGGETLAECVRRADGAMYAAKRAGRNRVIASEDAPEES